MLIKITRKRKQNKISKAEFDITKLFLDYFEAEYESDYSVTVENSFFWCGDKIIALPEHYSYINDEISREMILFRPLRNERHSNILIDMFEDLAMNVPMDRIEINEFLNDNDKKRYSGYMIVCGKVAETSIIKSAPSIPVLKTSIVAKIIFNKDDYKIYRSLLKQYLNEQKGDNNV